MKIVIQRFRWSLNIWCSAAFSVIFLLAAPGLAQAGQYLDFKYSDDGTNVTLTGYTGLGGSVQIPDSIAGMSVTSIGNQTFDGISSLTNITIPNSVTSIGNGAFSQCIGLKSVVIPKSVLSVGTFAFKHCLSLSSVAIGNNVNNIGQSAFENCSSLTSVTIPENVTTIESFTFASCSNLLNIVIPISVTRIQSGAFIYCTALKSVNIPKSVTNIGGVSFYRCNNMTNITVDPLNATYCSVDGVLFNKAQTTLVHFPEGKVGQYVVPNTVTNFVNNLFESCVNLTSVDISSVVTIPASTFSDCANLTNITVDPVNVAYSSMDGVLFNKNQTVLMQYPGGKTGEYLVPQSVTSIRDYAFYGCAALTRIAIPSSMTRSVINGGFYGFSSCSNLIDITVDPLNPTFSSVDGVLFNKDKKTLIQYPGGKSGDYIPPNTLTVIWDNAFRQCTGLKSVAIPDGVTLIKMSAFSGCTNMTHIEISSSVAVINDYAFWDCFSLAGIAIPERINYLGSGMLDNCINLTRVSIGKGLKRIWPSDFLVCPILTNITVDPLNAICSSRDGVLFNKDQTSLIKYPGGKTGHYLIPKSVISIEGLAFFISPSLLGVTIPNSVTNIGGSAFHGCTNLTAVYFEGNAPSIGAGVFSEADKVTVYYQANTTGWGPIFANRPTALWVPQPTYSEWAQTVGLTSQHPNASGEADDADNDGANNWAEMQAGTNPTDPNSALKFEAIARPDDLAEADKTVLENSQLGLYFQSVPGRTYALQASDAIGSPWQTEAAVGATTTQKRVVTNRPVNQRFYRLTILP
jgi:hypothetical protein